LKEYANELKILVLLNENYVLNVIFGLWQVCTAKMNLSEEVDLEDYVSRPDKISAAEVRISLWQLFCCLYWLVLDRC